MSRLNNLLLSMTPFLGISSERLMSLIEKVCLEFRTFREGDLIITPGMEADRLFLLLNGMVLIEREPVADIKVSWILKTSDPIDLPALFSLSLRHFVTVKALSHVEVVSMSREEF